MFPQMWITENSKFTSNEGQKCEDGVNINPFKTNFKSFFRSGSIRPFPSFFFSQSSNGDDSLPLFERDQLDSLRAPALNRDVGRPHPDDFASV